MPMTSRDYSRIAGALLTLRPSPETGTIAERALWARIVDQLVRTFAMRDANFSDQDFRQNAGDVPATMIEEVDL
jgi:hypothetical protein